jgi:phenylacetate-CoA ligase
MIAILKILLAKLNILYPNILGVEYWRYKNKRIKNNFYRFNSENEVVQVISNAISAIPYYNKKYSQIKINSLVEFLTNIDFIDKDIVMNNWEDFQLPGNHQKKIVTGTTGGTSGKPLKLVLPKNRYVFELATMYTMWENIGWHGQTRAVIRNAHLKENQSFKVNILKKEVIFDGFRTSKEYYYTVYNTLKKYKIQYIHAYPSSAYQFSIFLKNEKLDVSFIKGFFCGSEALLPEQKEIIQNQLGLKIYHWYGHSEKLVLGGYCKHSDLIHIEPTYGYFELIDEKGNQINEIGKVGEIVGTTLHNPYMPLIRYKTGDYAEYTGDYCPHCKRHLPLLKKVYGRWDKNKIYRSDGSFITTTALNLHSNLYNKIDGLQYIQKKKGELEILIIKGDSFKQDDYYNLKTHYENSFGKENKVFIKFVNKLNKLPNGKFLNLISEIN